MTPDELAAIHAASFTRPRPWTADEFRGLLAEPANFLIARDTGFLLGRTVLDEAELLTVAVAPQARRAGLGATLLASFEDQARARGAATAFLEVAGDNAAAAALYAGAGWRAAGRRRDYYGTGIDAVIMVKVL